MANDDVFTAQELQNIINAQLDYYMKGDAIAQTLQDRPTLKALRGKQKTFSGGRGAIKGNVKGDYSTTFMGYSGDDTVTYGNPANLKQFSYEWFELHAGISFTNTELKRAGISVVDTLDGARTRDHSDKSIHEITNLLSDKLDDMGEGSMRSFNLITWLDGSQSAKVFPGIQSIIRDDPTSGVIGGIDSALNPWWRNRALVGANKVTHSPTNQTLTKTLRSEYRQLRRFGGKPTGWYAGSGAINKLEAEIAEKGIYTQEGFMKNGATEVGMADITMRGVGQCQYDPTLDDLGRENFMYFVDHRHIFLMVMEGEDMKQHTPARPPEKYVVYRAVTWTGTLMANKLNCHEVIEVA